MGVSASPIINSFTGGELSPHLDGRTDHEKYYSGCRRLENFIPRPHGSVYKRPGTRFVAAAKNHGAPARLLSFDFNSTESQSYVIELGDGYMRFFTRGGAVLKEDAPAWALGAPYNAGEYAAHGGRKYRCLSEHTSETTTEPGQGGEWAVAWADDATYEISTPWSAAQIWEVNTVQNCDVMYLAHPDAAPRKLLRKAHDDWSLEELDYRMPGHDLELRSSDGASLVQGTAGAGTVTLPKDRTFEVCNILKALDKDGEERFFMYKGDGVFIADGKDMTMTVAGAPVYDNNQIEPMYSSGELQDKHWRLLEKNESVPAGWGADDGGTERWPSVVGLYEDRLVFGATRDKPLTLWMSRTGEHEDFRLNTASFVSGVQESPLDDDAIEITLSGSRVNPIRWIADQEELLVGTNAGELKVWSGLEGEGMTPGKVQRKRQSSHGSEAISPEPVSGAVIFVSRSGRKLREMAYNVADYRYTAPELTILAEHVTGPGVRDMAFAREPDGVLWTVRKDGVLAACTYLREQNVVAWHRHILGGGGCCESIATVPGEYGDELWLLVRRTVGDEVRRYIERFARPFEGGARYSVQDSTAAGAFHLDCGLSNCSRVDSLTVDASTGKVRVRAQGLNVADGDALRVQGVTGMEVLDEREFMAAEADAATGEFSLKSGSEWFDGRGLPEFLGGGTCWKRMEKGSMGGLSHLEGRSVDILLDGAVLPGQTVSGGAVSLPRPAWKVHVGFGYGAVLQPMRMEIATATGTSQTKRKRIMGVTLRFRQTVGGKVCPGDDVADKYERLLMHTLPARGGESPRLFSGDREVRLASGYDRDGLFTIRQDDPLPMTVVCCVPQVQGER